MTLKKRAADMLRTIATIAVHVAEEIDPQPEVSGVWPFTVHTPSGTQGAEARITWITKS